MSFLQTPQVDQGTKLFLQIGRESREAEVFGLTNIVAQRNYETEESDEKDENA